MSSTNRGYDRHKSDYYVTPVPVIEEFLDEVTSDLGDIFTGKDILDPCAGGDKTHPMSYPTAIMNKFKYPVYSMDIRKDSPAKRKGDFLKMELDKNSKFDIVITNPPFNIAEDIINKALEVTEDGGYVIMLLRLNFFGSQKRKDFWKKNMPIKTYVHSKRISFTEDGVTDSIEYMHAVWKKGSKNKFTELKVI